MNAEAISLMSVYEGWEGYQRALVHAIAPLTAERLAWRPAPRLRSAGEIASHIIAGRPGWFQRMGAPGSAELAAQIASWDSEYAFAQDAGELVRWLESTWKMVEETLKSWNVGDLARTYRHTYWGKTYATSRQWTIWRIMAHDLHHGGELAVTLGLQGIEVPELGDLGGHLTEPPLAEEP